MLLLLEECLVILLALRLLNGGVPTLGLLALRLMVALLLWGRICVVRIQKPSVQISARRHRTGR